MVVTEVADHNFEAEILQSDLMVFACFTASWCGSCFPACMSANSLAREYDQRIKFVRCDIERCAKMAERYEVGVFPTVILFQNSMMVKKLVGFKEKHHLRRLLESYLTVSATDC